MQSIYTDFFSEEKDENFVGGGSNEYPLCMFWIKIKKIRYTPANIVFFI